VNYLICEHMTEEDFPHANPLLGLELATKPFEQLRKEYGLSKRLNIIDNGLNKEMVVDRWPENLGASHERAMWIQEYMSKKINEYREEDPSKVVALLLVSHGMMVEQLGNLHEKGMDSKGEFRMLTPENLGDYSEEEKQKIVKSVQHLDWSGVPAIHYCCLNSFTAKSNPETGKIEDFEIQELKSNSVVESLPHKERGGQ